MTEYESSLEKFQETVKMTRRLANFCGMDVLADNYKPNLRTALTLIGGCSYLVTGMYSAWIFYPNIYESLQAVAPLGMALQGMMKMYSAIVYRSFFYGRQQYLEDFHRTYVECPQYNAALVSLMRKMQLAIKLLILSYLIAIAGFGLYPLYFYLIYGEKTLALNVLIPGVDARTYWGYVCTLAYQMFLLALAINGITAYDTAMMIFICNLAGLVDVYKIKLRELDALLMATKRSPVKIHDKLREIVIEHYEIFRYESELDKRYIVVNFVQVASSVACLTLSLFLCYMTNYLPGYAFIIGAVFQLLEFCLLGTIFSVKNDDVIVAIYDISWYLLDRSDIKMLNFMFHRSQNSVNLTIGGFAPLNIEVFVEIMKTIYQYFAMLIRFMEP
ncbi:putative odorant receptor 83c [Wyeomyia smithii]|uniref:putative odorant receptor 83c n=1 Tax=Wyeomyia smithii TaxID=174621 RepID=UPI002467AD24|nr:putative odorant receptor 83c [Wyeomyia smithii]